MWRWSKEMVIDSHLKVQRLRSPHLKTPTSVKKVVWSSLLRKVEKIRHRRFGRKIHLLQASTCRASVMFSRQRMFRKIWPFLSLSHAKLTRHQWGMDCVDSTIWVSVVKMQRPEWFPAVTAELFIGTAEQQSDAPITNKNHDPVLSKQPIRLQGWCSHCWPNYVMLINILPSLA